MDDIVLVDEEEISQAMLLLVERAKAVVEPSGAAARPPSWPGGSAARGRRWRAVGGNVDPLLLTKLIEHGLSGRAYLTLRMVMAGPGGALAALTRELARLGLNVLDVEHHRSGRDLALTEVEVQVTVETRAPTTTPRWCRP